MKIFRLTVVVDNVAGEGLAAEHGYSLFIEGPDGNILFDTGQKGVLFHNMDKLGIDPYTISTLVLSHGHYDHTGGVAEILQINRKTELYLHAAVFLPRYSLDGDSPKIVRMPLKAMEAAMHHSDERVHWLTRPVALVKNIGITGPISRENDFEDTGGPFYLDPEGRKSDTIEDDIAMWLHTPDGLVICVGCCHSGLINTLDCIIARTGENRIATIIGGLHMLNASPERLKNTVAKLREFEIDKIVACHCSGDKAVSYLRNHLDIEVVTGCSGLVLDF